VKKARFEWDKNKDKENQEKHGVAFEVAQYAFADPNRIIAEDLSQIYLKFASTLNQR